MLSGMVKSCARWLRNVAVNPTCPAAQRSFARLALEVLEARDTPSLTPVSASAGYPFTSIAKLYITFPDNKVFVGTGAMVDSFHVLTAGHNTYSWADGGWARSVKVVPQM